MTKKKPVHDFRLGRIRAAIWLNEDDNGQAWFNVSITRRYRNGEGWRDSASFSRDDLPVVGRAVDMAYAWIWGRDAVVSDPAEDEAA